jgi:hypothetical protein
VSVVLGVLFLAIVVGIATYVVGRPAAPQRGHVGRGDVVEGPYRRACRS